MLSKEIKLHIDDLIPSIANEIFEKIDEILDRFIMNDEKLKKLSVEERLQAIEYVLDEIRKAM